MKWRKVVGEWRVEEANPTKKGLYKAKTEYSFLNFAHNRRARLIPSSTAIISDGNSEGNRELGDQYF